MPAPSTEESHRSGFVAMAGRPNVGKSTLLNALLKQSVMAVSSKPQTTRRRQLGILTLPGAQIVFVDTPGIHEPRHQLGESMNWAALEALEDADVALGTFDLHLPPSGEDALVAGHLSQVMADRPALAALNKLDLLSPDDSSDRRTEFEALLPEVEKVEVSATRGDGLERLLGMLVERLPFAPAFYPGEEITDAYERDIAADLIRAAGMELLHQEVPHSIAVRIDEYKERGDGGAYIAATLFVERESQKGIVIGKGGTMLRDIGTRARESIEGMSGRKVYLETRVKVMPGWRNDKKALKRLGYRPKPPGNRV